MSETSEVPLTPTETGEPPQSIRLEDMEEFKKLAPEQQKQALEIRDRIMGEVQEPITQVAVSTEQMGLFAELGKFYKDTTAKRLGLLWKDVKAVGIGTVAALPLVDKAYAGLSLINKGKAFKQGYSAVRTGNFAAKGQALRQAEFVVDKGKFVIEGAKNPTGFFKAVGAGLRNVSEASRVREATNAAHFAAKNIATATRQAITAEQAAYLHTAHQMGLDKGITGKIATSVGARRLGKEMWKSTKAGMKQAELLKNTQVGKLSTIDKLKVGLKVEGRLAKDVVTDKLRSHMFREGVKHPAVPGILVSSINMAEELGLDQGKKGRKTLGKVMEFIDPTPDVPNIVSFASFGADLLVPGVGVVPFLYQFARNRIASMQLYGETAKQGYEIVKKHWNKKFSKLKEPEVAKAAEAFVAT